MNKQSYNGGTSAIDYKELRRRMDEPPHKVDPIVARNQQKALYLTFPYVLFMSVSFIVVAFIAIAMVHAQENLKEQVNLSSKLESRYVTLKNENDANYDRIYSSVDMVEIKRKAIEELGMHYPTEGQIVHYTNTLDDYVRQYKDIK